MIEKTTNQDAELQPPDDRIPLRQVSLMNCEISDPGTAGKNGCAVLTFGGDDGSIEQVELNRQNAKLLFRQLALALHLTSLPCGPAHFERIYGRWLVPHTPFRAALNVDGDGSEYLDGLRREMPELGEYIDKSLASLTRSLRPTGRSAATANTIIKRLKKLLMIAVDTARIDT